MERLTEYILDNYDNVKEVLKKENVLEIDLIRKLALFEDTYLEPSEIEQLKGKREVLWEKIDKLTSEVISAYRERDKFRVELAEKDRLLENTVIPKFKIGDEVWIIKRIKQEVANGKIIKKYLYFNGGTPENLRNVNRWRIRLRNNSEVTKKEYELFYTRKEAEDALKKLEGK